MNRCGYREAVEKGINALGVREYSPSCRSAFRMATREFEGYMQGLDLTYSPQLAQQWVNEYQGCWKPHKIKSTRKAMHIVADIIEHGRITTSLQNPKDRRPSYTQLPPWSCTVLDRYLATLQGSCGTVYRRQIRNACARFFLFLADAGISQPTDITHAVVHAFFRQNRHVSSAARDRTDNAIRGCLQHMADKGLLADTIGQVLNKFVRPDVILVAQLPPADQRRFTLVGLALMNDPGGSRADYEAGVKHLAEIHECQKYSRSIRQAGQRATQAFRVFMDANGFAYSHDLALAWLAFQRPHWSPVKYLTARRVLLSIDEISRTGGLSTRVFTTQAPRYVLPPWGQGLLSPYLREREREGCAPSTMAMIHHACSRFLVFLDHHGVVNAPGITPAVVKAFHLQDAHRTVSGKNAYAVKIRGFLRFLARQGYVPDTLAGALSTEMAPHTTLVRTLSEPQIAAIYTFRQRVDRPLGLRNAAIILLGLRMGLRASDIVHLKLSDIAWDEGAIAFVQQKTGARVHLPFPTDVGNSLYRYIRDGRPASEAPWVFIHHRAPYGGFQRGSFGRVLTAAVAAQGNREAIRGFHITRKTYASKLLAGGTPVGTIAAALGHVGVGTVQDYLAADDDHLRLCALGLQGLEYAGRYDL